MKNPFPFHQTSFHYHDLKSPTHLEEGESYRPFLNKQVFDGSCRCTIQNVTVLSHVLLSHEDPCNESICILI